MHDEKNKLKQSIWNKCMQANLGEPYYIVLYNLNQPRVPFNNKLRDGTSNLQNM